MVASGKGECWLETGEGRSRRRLPLCSTSPSTASRYVHGTLRKPTRKLSSGMALLTPESTCVQLFLPYHRSLATAPTCCFPNAVPSTQVLGKGQGGEAPALPVPGSPFLPSKLAEARACPPTQGKAWGRPPGSGPGHQHPTVLLYNEQPPLPKAHS